MTSVENVSKSEYVEESAQDVGGPIDRLINALGTDPGLWRQVSISFNSADGLQVSMHHARWAVVTEMVLLLGLDSQPDEYHRLESGSSTIVVAFAYQASAMGGVSVVWFTNQEYAETTFGVDVLHSLLSE
jgi:hypothetical protein